MSELTVSAPGKAMILGEYAVVAGGWAVVASVDRRVTVSRSEQAGASYEVIGPVEGDVSLVQAVIKAAEESVASNLHLRPEHFRADVTEMFVDGRKLGLGSSAASAVALMAAALGESHIGERETIFERGSVAHARWQGGRGSGAGVAASTWGAHQAYRQRAPDSPLTDLVPASEVPEPPDGATQVGTVDRMTLTRPESLRFELVELPTDANTRSFLDAVIEVRATRAQKLGEILGQLADIGWSGLRAFQAGDAQTVTELVGRAEASMEHLGAVADVPIVTDDHRRLSDIVGAQGLAAKPSGAGGGDVSLVAGPRDADWESAMAAIDEDGVLNVVGAKLGVEGIRGIHR